MNSIMQEGRKCKRLESFRSQRAKNERQTRGKDTYTHKLLELLLATLRSWLFFTTLPDNNPPGIDFAVFLFVSFSFPKMTEWVREEKVELVLDFHLLHLLLHSLMLLSYWLSSRHFSFFLSFSFSLSLFTHFYIPWQSFYYCGFSQLLSLSHQIHGQTALITTLSLLITWCITHSQT